MKLKIAILAGDGIGPEIMKQGVAVMNAIAKKCGHEFEYEEALVGACAIDACGDAYPDSTHDVCLWRLIHSVNAFEKSPKRANPPSMAREPK